MVYLSLLAYGVYKKRLKKRAEGEQKSLLPDYEDMEDDDCVEVDRSPVAGLYAQPPPDFRLGHIVTDNLIEVKCVSSSSDTPKSLDTSTGNASIMSVSSSEVKCLDSSADSVIKIPSEQLVDASQTPARQHKAGRLKRSFNPNSLPEILPDSENPPDKIVKFQIKKKPLQIGGQSSFVNRITPTKSGASSNSGPEPVRSGTHTRSLPLKLLKMNTNSDGLFSNLSDNTTDTLSELEICNPESSKEKDTSPTVIEAGKLNGPSNEEPYWNPSIINPSLNEHTNNQPISQTKHSNDDLEMIPLPSSKRASPTESSVSSLITKPREEERGPDQRVDEWSGPRNKLELCSDITGNQTVPGVQRKLFTGLKIKFVPSLKIPPKLQVHIVDTGHCDTQASDPQELLTKETDIRNGSNQQMQLSNPKGAETKLLKVEKSVNDLVMNTSSSSGPYSDVKTPELIEVLEKEDKNKTGGKLLEVKRDEEEMKEVGDQDVLLAQHEEYEGKDIKDIVQNKEYNDKDAMKDVVKNEENSKDDMKDVLQNEENGKNDDMKEIMKNDEYEVDMKDKLKEGNIEDTKDINEDQEDEDLSFNIKAYEGVGYFLRLEAEKLKNQSVKIPDPKEPKTNVESEIHNNLTSGLTANPENILGEESYAMEELNNSDFSEDYETFDWNEAAAYPPYYPPPGVEYPPCPPVSRPWMRPPRHRMRFPPQFPPNRLRFPPRPPNRMEHRPPTPRPEGFPRNPHGFSPRQINPQYSDHPQTQWRGRGRGGRGGRGRPGEMEGRGRRGRR